ncbi:8702_t:CDS:10 [Paraglomus occultum]|uniref:8702_t:CDS:1 n=1 Tax=Paraglomus occultum TaxID=144539 RepID=A0A9N9BFM5_9GLOM|nr:8702_t:CDS:10 [Paraglomus occultum]
MSFVQEAYFYPNTSFPSDSLPSGNSQPESLLYDDSIKLECPICNEAMISLAQLNQHLDDVHSEESNAKKDVILNWFKNAQSTIMKPLSKAKLASLPNQLSHTVTQTVINKLSEIDALDEGSELVTRSHWQRESENDQCSHSNCGKTVNLRNGKYNCRKCGKLFCEAHCHLQMKLSRQALHDPVNGYWSRVCNNCYKSREGYLDDQGVVSSRTEEFKQNRVLCTEKAHLEGNRLEKRLEKLAKVYATKIKTGNSAQGGLAPPLTLKHRRRASEQSIVKWEDDASNQDAKRNDLIVLLSERLRTVSTTVVYADASSTRNVLRKSHYIRAIMQKTMNKILLAKYASAKNVEMQRREYIEEVSKTPQIVMFYQKLTKVRSAIDQTLPKFQEMLVMLKSQEIVNQTHADYQVAARTRKELLEYFTQFDAISKKINSLATNSETQRRLHSNIYLAANQYLQQVMLPLSALPKIFKKDLQDQHSPQQPQQQAQQQQKSLPINKVQGDEETDSAGDILAAIATRRNRSLSVSSSKSTRSTKSAKGEKLRQQLGVLEEQEKLVEEYISKATRKRKIEDVQTLKASLDELRQEIDIKKQQLVELS